MIILCYIRNVYQQLGIYVYNAVAKKANNGPFLTRPSVFRQPLLFIQAPTTKRKAEDPDMKKLLLLAVSLALIASIGISGTLAFRTYFITNHSITRHSDASASATVSADQSPAPLAMQVSNGAKLADFSVRARGVQALNVDNNVATDQETPSGAEMSIEQHTYQRDASGGLTKVSPSESNTATRTILAQLLPSPAFQNGSTPAKTCGYWNDVGAVDHILTVSYTYTPANDGDTTPTASVRTVFAFPNPTLADGSSFMDKIYLNWQDESKLATFESDRNYTDFYIGGSPYRVYVYTYPTVASSNETDFSLLQVAMDASITNADVDKLSPYGGFAVKIASQAVTDDAGENAKNAVFTEITETSNPWSNT